MKSYVSLRRIAGSIAALAAAIAPFLTCCTTADDTLGYELVPEDQKMEMRFKNFQAGKVTKYDPETKEYVTISDRPIFKTTLFRSDSLISSNLQVGYMGVQNDPDGIFGKRSAGYASEFLFMAQIEDTGFGYLPIFDSMQMLLSVTDYTGDTTYVQTYEVYEIISSIEESMINDDDTIAYINHDMSKLYDPSKLLFTFRFPDQENGIYTTSTAVTMQPADLSANGATWDFVKRLMLIDDLDDGWDGYADDTEIYQDDEKWVNAFKGLYIKPQDNLADDAEGGMYETDFSATGIYMLGRNRNPDEPMLIKDTTYMYYYFYVDDAKFGNKSINTVSHDFSNSTVMASATMTDDPDKTADENRLARTESAIGYISGMGGPVMEMYFTDEFLNELYETGTEDGFSKSAVNQARLYVYLEGSDYDWLKLDPATITPLLDESITRLGLYTDYDQLTGIPDYNYAYEKMYNTTLAYGGNLNRSWASYVMDISSYIQRLKNYVDWLVSEGKVEKGENGLYTFTFNPDDTKYISRTIYLGPEAYDAYTFKRSKVQGMESALNNASMRIDLTYTMIK